jgi:lysozyme family protein
MANFEIAFNKTMENEGGFSNDPDDHGGITKFGISKKSFPDEDIANLTLERAKQIYKYAYWDKMHCDEIISQPLADKIFDLGVNLGCGRIVKIIQRLLDLVVDGIIGIKTIGAINNQDASSLLSDIREKVKDYYASLDQPKFIHGWLNRLYRD